MELHKKYLQKKIARNVAPLLSRVILFFRMTGMIRKLIAFLNYLIGRGAGMGWGMDAEVAAALHCIKRDNPVVFDVGANVGQWSQRYRLSQPKGELFMFEPQRGCQNLIQEKNIDNAILVKAAVGRSEGKLRLFSSSETDISASLHQREETFFKNLVYVDHEVSVISLDRFIEDQGIDFVDYIKFDIEGHELEALHGMIDNLSNGRVGAFSFEFGSGNLNSKTCFRDFWKLLKLNYYISIITPSGKLQAVDEYYEDMEFYRGVSNFVAQLK